MRNRRFKALDKAAQAKLIDCFPGLASIISNDDTHDYQHVAVTIYDHWLSEEDASRELNDMTLENHKIYDAKLHSFVCSLTSNFESYLVKSIGRYKQNITFRAFTSELAKNKTLTPLPYLASNAHRFVFVVPSLQLIYTEGWDFTHHVFLKDKASIDTLKSEAERAGVYVL